MQMQFFLFLVRDLNILNNFYNIKNLNNNKRTETSSPIPP